MMSDHTKEKVALASAVFAGLNAKAQEKASTQKAEHDHSSSDPVPENKALLGKNPNSNTPPPAITAMQYRSGIPSIWSKSASRKVDGPTR
jgi:hypothetical protein